MGTLNPIARYKPLYSHYKTPISLGSLHINPHKLQGSLVGVPPKVLLSLLSRNLNR